MADWHFNVGDDGYVGCLDVERHSGESLAHVGDPRTSYGDIDQFREFAEHFTQLKALRDQLDQQVRELLSSYKVWKNATESRLKLLNGREPVDTMIPADRALVEAFEQVRKERGDG